jgi:hypothetical protein
MENINYLPFATIAAAFVLLKDNVHVALHTQLGDAAQLQAQINECGQLLVQITQVRSTSYLLYIELTNLRTLARADYPPRRPADHATRH